MEFQSKGKSVVYLADKAFAAHTILTLIGLGWAILINAPWLGLAVAVLWALTGLIWLEWKNS